MTERAARVSGVEGTGWNLDRKAEKVLQKHGLFFTDIKCLVFPVCYKTYNFPKLVSPTKFHIKHWRPQKGKDFLKSKSQILKAKCNRHLSLSPLKEHLSKGISVS